jgi:hypothetical protein
LSVRGLAKAQQNEGPERPIAPEVPLTHGLLDREHLLRKLDRSVTRRATVISAPAGSGKTSLLRAWADRSSDAARVAFVSVDRDEQEAQRFWSRVLDAIRDPAAATDRQAQPAAAGVPGHDLVDAVVAELAGRGGPFVLIIDDLHELRSADAVAQLQRLLAVLPSSARVVLSSRRDPPIRLHKLRLADELAELRAADLRFTERETRELLAASRPPPVVRLLCVRNRDPYPARCAWEPRRRAAAAGPGVAAVCVRGTSVTATTSPTTRRDEQVNQTWIDPSQPILRRVERRGHGPRVLCSQDRPTQR